MNLELKFRTAVATGASIGIGRAIATSLAMEGVRLVAVARRKELLSQLAQELQAAGRNTVIPVVLDIVGEDAAKKLADAAIAELGIVDILANNAGGTGLCRWTRPIPTGTRPFP